MRPCRAVARIDLVTRVCRPDGLITQLICFLPFRCTLSSDFVFLICSFQIFSQDCPHGSGTLVIDYNPQDNPWILPVICAQQRHRPRTRVSRRLPALAR